MPRIAPVVPPYSDALRQRFARLMPPEMTPPAIFRAVARNEALFIHLWRECAGVDVEPYFAVVAQPVGQLGIPCANVQHSCQIYVPLLRPKPFRIFKIS